MNAQFPLVAEVEEVEPKDVVGDAVIREDEVKDDELQQLVVITILLVSVLESHRNLVRLVKFAIVGSNRA